MRLLIIHLKKESQVVKAGSLLLELGLFDAAVLDGESLENLGVGQAALFSSFQNLFGGGSAYNRTILVPVPDTETVKDFLHLCEQEGIRFQDPEVGWILVLPTELFVGPEDLLL